MSGERANILTATIFATILLIGPGAIAAGNTIKLVERATTDRISVHGGPAADNVGDILTFANEVFDAANTVRIGSDQGYCLRLVVGKSFECHWTLTLSQGQIAVDGPFLDAGDSVLAITGGTGIYNAARGEMRLHARDTKGGAYDFTYLMN